MSDILVWTIADAPLEGEALLLPPSLPAAALEPQTEDRTRKIALQIWVIAISLSLGLLAVLWLEPALNDHGARLAVAQVVAAEERAALARNETQLKQLSDPTDPNWLEAQARRAGAGQSGPLPLRMLRPVPEAGQVRTFETITPGIVRVEVARRFTVPDGTALTFRLPQFYRFEGHEWKRIASPDDYWGDQIFDVGAHLDFVYYPVDQDLVKALRPYLADVLARACGLWTCLPDLKITINFANRYYQPPEVPIPLAPDEPLLLALMPPHLTRWGGYTLYLLSPHEVGYATEAAGQDLLRRAVAAQLLFAAADQLTYANDGLDQTGNAFFYALIARMAARLGLDSPHVADLRSASTTLTPQQMWTVNEYFKAWYQPEEIRGALAIVNRLLQDQPANTDIRLFHSLRSAREASAWLADGMGVPVEAAQSALQVAATNTRGGHLETFTLTP